MLKTLTSSTPTSSIAVDSVGREGVAISGGKVAWLQVAQGSKRTFVLDDGISVTGYGDTTL